MRAELAVAERAIDVGCYKAGSPSPRLVMGLFTDGPPAGRLHVEGADVPDRGARALQERMAIYAIPRPAVRRRRTSPVLDAALGRVRSTWLAP